MEVPYSRYVFGTLGWYGVLIVLGMALAVLLANRESDRLGLEKDTGTDLALCAIPAGIIGARLYYVLFSWEEYAAHPITALYLWEGGLAIYGGIIGGTIGVLIYSLVKKKNFGVLLDCLAPGIALAQALGRWGNYFNMEAYGRQILDARFCFFPVGVLIGSEWHMATFFYESLWNLGTFAVLWFGLRKRLKTPGALFSAYLLIYGSGRFIIEQLREDSLYLMGIRASQWLSLALCVTGAFWLLSGTRKKKLFRLFAVLLLAARWLLLHSPVWYLTVSAFAFAVVLLLCKGRCRVWTAAAFCADMIGTVCFFLKLPFSEAFALCLHAFICSITLPAGVFLMLETERKGENGCPSEN